MQIVYGHLKALRLDSLSNYLAGGLPCLLLCKFGNGRELCLAEAIAARLMGWGEEGNDDDDEPFPLRDALCFLALMQGKNGNGYVPKGFQDCVKEEQKKENNRDQEKKLCYRGQMETIGGGLVIQLYKVGKDREKTTIANLQQALVAPMEGFGLEVACKLKTAYGYLEEAQWTLLLKLLQKPNLNLLLLLKDGNGNELCLAEAIATKMAKDQNIVFEEAFGFLTLMQGSDRKGYVPRGLVLCVDGMRNKE